MYKRPDNNPFGEWNKIPEHKANMSLNEQEEFEHLWEELCTEDISESEVTSYLEKLNTNVLNEAGYGEHGWFGVSPFAWTEGFRLNSIFKPLKWLALPLIGGVVLLLAGIWKLLKEGKKQIAIAKVRAWIEKLVVVADSGLKKTRSTKDSLFLIRQRYRRDILQNAVKVATCLGIDIPEKDDKPQEVETSLNESAESLKEDPMPDQENQSEETKTSKEHNIDLSIGGLLPDDSRVDWSLMNSIRASQWFGLKHKTTDFWKEAKSVAKVNVSSEQGNPLRECGLITAYVSQSLTLVANSGIAQSYSSIMNKYIEILTKVKTDDATLKNNTRPIPNNRFNTNSNVYDSKFEMFKEDFKVFEANEHNDYRSMIFTWWSDKKFQEYLKEIGEFQKVQQQILSQISINDPKIPEEKFRYLESLYIRYNEEKLGQMIDILGEEGENISNNRQRDKEANADNVDYSKVNVDNIDKYLIAALSKILANTDYTQWQMHSDAYNQMIKFINELTKSVHTVIDSVAKKVEERLGTSQNTFEQAILRFVSSKPDAKQNRSLKNLWDNIGVSKLQQRTIVHCQEIDQSPEMQYYLDMFMITVPKIIKEKLGVMKAEGQKEGGQDSSTNTGNGN